LGIGDWGLGIGEWGLGPIPNPQSPIPNPQSPLHFSYLLYLLFNLIDKNKILIKVSNNINLNLIMTSFNFNRQNQDLYSNGFRGNNNLNYNEFRFKFEGTKFLWKELMRLNEDHIERSGDISILEPYVENILYSRMNPDDIDYLSNDYITQLITLLQLIGQYFVYIQERLESENQDLRLTINELQEKIKDSERSEKLYDELKNQNKEKDFIIKTYQNMVKNGYGLSNEIDKNIVINDENINLRSKKLVHTERKYYPCSICAGKKFKSQKYLDEHIKRRHYGLIESDFDQEKESNLENKNYKQVFEGRLNDMKIYFENILKNVEANNGINLLSRKIDNIQNQIIYEHSNNNRLNSNSNVNGICAVCGNHLHNMMNPNNMNIFNINKTKSFPEEKKNINDNNKLTNRKEERKEEININIDYKINDNDKHFERDKKRSVSSRVNKDSSRLVNNNLSRKEENTSRTTNNININIQSKNPNQNQNNSLGESTKNEFKSSSKNNESNNTTLKNGPESSKIEQKDNNPSNNLNESKKFINVKTPGGDYNLKNSHNSKDNDENQNNKIGKNDYINASNKSDNKDDNKILSSNNPNKSDINSSLNKNMKDQKEGIDSFYKKYMERDHKFKEEKKDYAEIELEKFYENKDNTINIKITERLGDDKKVKKETVDKLINKCIPDDDTDNDINYKKCIYDALDLSKIIEDYKKLMSSRDKSKNSKISNQNNKTSEKFSNNQQSISENKKSSKIENTNSVAKEQDNNYNNNKFNDQTTISILGHNLDQTNNPNNPQVINQNIVVGYDLTKSVNN